MATRAMHPLPKKRSISRQTEITNLGTEKLRLKAELDTKNKQPRHWQRGSKNWRKQSGTGLELVVTHLIKPTRRPPWRGELIALKNSSRLQLKRTTG